MSIFGNGFIAKNLKKIKLPSRFEIYAAGVSNSNLKLSANTGLPAIRPTPMTKAARYFMA